MKTPPDVQRVRVRVFDRDVPAFRDADGSWRALIGIDLDVEPGVTVVTIDARAGKRELHATRELAVGPHKFATRTLNVDEAYVNPPAEVQTRIARDAADLQHVWQSSAPERLWTGAFVRPVPGRSVSRFGTRSIFNGQLRNPHNGGARVDPLSVLAVLGGR